MNIPNLTKYQLNKAKKNLEAIFLQATEEHKKSGLLWYQTAHNICKNLNEETENQFTPEQIAGVIAALSPRNKWERNILDAYNVLKAVKLNKKPQAVKVCTFNKNKEKAFNIAKGKESIKPTARKTSAFVSNIATLDENRVTIDLWHLRALFGKTITGGLTPKKYDILEELTIKVANKFGLKGYEFQAIIWEQIRNNWQ